MSLSDYIKRPGIETEYTDEQIKEVIRCKADLLYFAKNYIYVVHPTKGLIKWEARDYQIRIIKAYQESRFNIVMAARQVGKSTVSMIYLLWKAMFNDNLDIAVLANKFSSSREVLKRIQEAYLNLPIWLKNCLAQKTSARRQSSITNMCHCEATLATVAISGLVVT